MLKWRDAGKIQLPQQIHDGLENAPDAFCSLFTGASSGKQLVRIAS
jgi:NADPH-dependent curcumin reductase CurA